MKELRVSGTTDNMNVEAINSFARSLKTNTSLTNLRIYNDLVRSISLKALRRIEFRVAKAFTSVLCCLSSIERTYSSNHTLHTLSIAQWIPTKLARTLEINRNENKSAVARQKIIAYHFSSDKLDIQVFIGMAVPVLPRALEWIGQDATGFNLMYHVTRGILSTLTRMWPT